jgi:hypothetical protein
MKKLLSIAVALLIVTSSTLAGWQEDLAAQIAKGVEYIRANGALGSGYALGINGGAGVTLTETLEFPGKFRVRNTQIAWGAEHASLFRTDGGSDQVDSLVGVFTSVHWFRNPAWLNRVPVLEVVNPVNLTEVYARLAVLLRTADVMDLSLNEDSLYFEAGIGFKF